MNNTETSSTVPFVSAPQYRKAFALGAAFSHGWVECCPDPKDVHGNVPLAELETLVSRKSRKQTELGFLGIPMLLRLNERGFVEHTTGTGRVHWTIDVAGNVVVSIRRPETGECLSAFISKKGDVHVRLTGGHARWRHGSSLLDVTDALNATDAACANSAWLREVRAIRDGNRKTMATIEQRKVEYAAAFLQSKLLLGGEQVELSKLVESGVQAEYDRGLAEIESEESAARENGDLEIATFDDRCAEAGIERRPAAPRTPRVAVPPHKLDTRGMSPMDAAKARNMAAIQAFEARKAARAGSKAAKGRTAG